MFRYFAVVLFAGYALGQTTTADPKALSVQTSDTAALNSVVITRPVGAGATVTGAPYSAQITTERVQVLQDGNRIVQTTSGTVARDGQGRTRREESVIGLKAANGEPPRMVMIDDPVAQVHWTLDTQKKIAMKTPLPPGKPGAAIALSIPDTDVAFAGGPVTIGNTAHASSGLSVIRKDFGSDDVNSTKSDLGTQTIQGVPATGTRIARTIPAGQIGNEQPIVITTETWYSPDLKVLVMSKSTDPRMGDTNYTLSNIERGEPSATLFQVPDDYTVKDESHWFTMQKPQ